MIKKIILVLIILCLASCAQKDKTIEEKLEELGYTEIQISAIKNLSSVNQETFLSEYNSDIQLITHEDFKEENLEEYKKYLNYFDTNLTFYLVNNEIVNENNVSIIKLLLGADYCIVENLKDYLQLMDSGISNIRTVVETVNCKAHIADYTEYQKADLTKGDYILVNKHYYLGKDYVPDNIIKIDSINCYKDCYLRQDAYDAYLKMIEEARSKGLDFFITSGYRSYETQEKIYNGYLQKDSVEKVDTYSARPGFSEHQTGLAIDILKSGYNFQTFGITQEAKWLDENAYRFGFILRYPSEKKSLTGYVYESWHYRYVGEEIAKYIHNTGITYDEYYAYYIAK